IALRFDAEERADGRRLLGLLVGFGGVVMLLGIDVAGRVDELIGALMILLATVGYAIGPMVVKHQLGGLHPLGSVSGSLVVSAALLAPPALLSAPPSVPSAAAIGSVMVLGIVCSAIAFVLYFA